MHKMKWWIVLATLVASLFLVPGAYACGGFFCTNVPVDQAAERIIFAVNDDGTIDAYVQINYTGAPDAFAWVVPVPNPPKVDVATMAMLRELDRLTQPVYVAPPLTSACQDAFRRVQRRAAAHAGADGGKRRDRGAGGRRDRVRPGQRGTV